MGYHIEQGEMHPANTGQMILVGPGDVWFNKGLLTHVRFGNSDLTPVVFATRKDAEDWIAARAGSFAGDIQIVQAP